NGIHKTDPLDLTPISGLTKMTELPISGNDIRDIGPLARLTNIWILTASQNDITDLSPLENLLQLNWLSIEDNQIADTTVLGRLPALIYLNLARNRIRDISSLVANSGIGAGDIVRLDLNCLDLSPGSPDMNDINALLDRGVSVNYEPQRDCL